MIKWRLRNKNIDLSTNYLIMGILNVTPDSFSDGGKYLDIERAEKKALKMLKHGADIIDIGGESTRPNSCQVKLEEELKRTIPIIKKIRQNSAFKNTYISIDTTKAEVAHQALDNGADIINDISAFTRDKEMLNLFKKKQCPTVIMHMQGNPQNMQKNPNYINASQEVKNYLYERLEFINDQIKTSNLLAIDPGIGFGKTPNHNLEIIKNLEIYNLDNNTSNYPSTPLLIGLSRKSFIGHFYNIQKTNKRDHISAFLNAICYQKSARIIRTHNVKITKQALDTVELLGK